MSVGQVHTIPIILIFYAYPSLVMATPVKDILLVGFGAVGAIYSLILKRSGLVRVTTVARSNYDVVKSNGMHFRSRKYGNIKDWKPDRLVNSVSAALDRPYSYVFVTTKAIPDLIKTPDILAPLFSAPYVDQYSQPTYVLLQNGLNVEIDLYEALVKLGQGDPKIISSAVYIGVNLLESNIVEHSDFDKLVLGMYRHEDYTTMTNTFEESALLADIGGILEAGGSTITIVPEIQRVKFTKNFWNVAFSSFSALTGYPLPSIFRSPPTDPSATYSPYVSLRTAGLVNSHTIPTINAVLLEVLAVGRALGFDDSDSGLPSSVVQNTMDDTARIHISPNSTHRPSMLLDVERGQPIEVEAIVGEVVRMGQQKGVSIPRIEMLYALLLVVQNQILRKLETK